MARLRHDVLGLAAGAVLGVALWSAQKPAADAPPATATVVPAPSGAGTASAQKPAIAVAQPTKAPLLAAARAGARLVAVGDHGVVLLSDDAGRNWRQAHSVPSQALLTGVSFVDAQQGWIAGHDGVVLHTQDGGETWTLQREDLDGDRPLLAIAFRDALHGLAVGLFGTAIATDDGGARWRPLAIETGAENDHHLYAIFGDADTGLYVAGEQGRLYRSGDAGSTWREIETGNPGSFWAGARLGDGSLLAVGQRGHVFRSADDGAGWREIAAGTQDSLTAVVATADGARIVGLAGAMLESRDGGQSFVPRPRADREPLNAALVAADGRLLLFGGNGVVHDAAGNPETQATPADYDPGAVR